MNPSFPLLSLALSLDALFPSLSVPDMNGRSGQVVFPRSCQCELPEWIPWEPPVGTSCGWGSGGWSCPFSGVHVCQQLRTQLASRSALQLAQVAEVRWIPFHWCSDLYRFMTLINFDLATFRWKAVILEWTAQLLLGVQTLHLKLTTDKDQRFGSRNWWNIYYIYIYTPNDSERNCGSEHPWSV